VQYKTAPVERRNIVARVTASGTLSALVTVQVGTQVSGRIQKLFADFNSPVKKGQLVAKIDPQLFEASMQQAQANYLSAKAGAATAEANALNAAKQLARAKALHDENLASQADLDTAEANVATTQASIQASKAGIQQALASLRPSDGSTVQIAQTTEIILAAGVSTCAPIG
jgi:HlyD family secretion protein